MNLFQKNAWAMAAGIVVVGGLAAAVYLGLLKTPEPVPHSSATDEPLAAARGHAGSSLDVRTLRVELHGKTSLAERREDGWWLTQPTTARADKAAIEAIVRALQSATFKSLIEASPSASDLAKYGLNPPVFSVRAEGTLDGAPWTLVLSGGIENSFDGSVYMRKGEDPKVYAAAGNVRVSLKKTAWDLRDKEIASFEVAKVRRLELKGQAVPQPIALERMDASSWKLVQPFDSKADSTGVSRVLATLRNVRALSFPEDAQGMSFDKPWADVTLGLRDGRTMRLRLIQRMADGEPQTWLLAEDGNHAVVAEVPSAWTTVLTQSALDLRDKSVLSFSKNDVTRITFSPPAPGEPFTVSRVLGAGGRPTEEWILEGTKTSAKKWKLSQLLWTLESLKVTSDTHAQEAKKAKLDKPFTLTLTGEKGKILAQLLLGEPVAHSPDLQFVRTREGPVLVVEAARLADLPKRASDVVDSGKSSTLADGGVTKG